MDETAQHQVRSHAVLHSLGEAVVVGGHQVVAPERCVLEAGSRTGVERTLVMLDSVLFLEKYSDDLLCTCFEALAQWPYMRSGLRAS